MRLQDLPPRCRKWEGPGWRVVCGHCHQAPPLPLERRVCPHCGQFFVAHCLQDRPRPWRPQVPVQLARLAMPEITPVLGALRTQLVPGDTMGVDYCGKLYVGEEAVKGERWNATQAAGVVLHEAMHLLKRHHWRAKQYGVRGQEDATHPRAQQVLNSAWNWGADAEINNALDQYLANNPHAEIPPDGIYPEGIGMDPGLSCEAYFRRALELHAEESEATPGGNEDGGGQGFEEKTEVPFGGSAADGVERDHEEPDDGQGGQDEQQDGHDEQQGGQNTQMPPAGSATDALAQRAGQQLARSGRGNARDLAHGIGIKDARDVTVSGIHKLRTIVRRSAQLAQRGRDRRTYGRLSRMSQPGQPMPTTRSVTPRITLVIDTSGSMECEGNLERAIACIRVVRQQFRDQKGIQVVTGDMACRSLELNVKSAEQVLQTLQGGGGTDMAAIMREVVDRHQPEMMIVATDGDTPWPREDEMRGVPCVIALTDPDCCYPSPTWATVIHVTDETKHL